MALGSFRVKRKKSEPFYKGRKCTDFCIEFSGLCFEWFASYTKNLMKDKVYLGVNSSHDIEGQGIVMIPLGS